MAQAKPKEAKFEKRKSGDEGLVDTHYSLGTTAESQLSVRENPVTPEDQIRYHTEKGFEEHNETMKGAHGALEMGKTLIRKTNIDPQKQSGPFDTF